jgi:hypothetical protein
VFTVDGGLATVDCDVYGYDSGEYVYAYQITNESTTALSAFLVGILPGADAYGPACDSGAGLVDPTLWSVGGSPVDRVQAAFFDALIGNGQTSAVLWFQSSYASTFGHGMLSGAAGGVPCSATGSLLVPAPEPATILLLGIGGALLTVSRRRGIF